MTASTLTGSGTPVEAAEAIGAIGAIGAIEAAEAGIGKPWSRASAARVATLLSTPLGGQLARFAVIGAGSTALNLVLLALLTAPWGAQTANAVGLAVSTVANTAANRVWTFGVRGGGMARQHLQSMLVLALTWGMSSGALTLLALASTHPSTGATVAVVALANAVSTVVRFAAMRSWIFRDRG